MRLDVYIVFVVSVYVQRSIEGSGIVDTCP